MVTICVTGSRDWEDEDTVKRAFKDAMRYFDVIDPLEYKLLHGAARGLDSIAAKIGNAWGFRVIAFPADWDKYKRQAGPIRNLEMLDEKPELVLAFPKPDSKGTIHCITHAIKRQIPIKVYYENV